MKVKFKGRETCSLEVVREPKWRYIFYSLTTPTLVETKHIRCFRALRNQDHLH